MTEPITSIRNLGPATAKLYARVGITTADQIRNLGAEAAYKLLLEDGDPPHFIGYYAVVMGLQGRPWNDCQGVEKENLRKVFDDLVTDTLGAKKKGRSDIEAALDKLGVRSTD